MATHIKTLTAGKSYAIYSWKLIPFSPDRKAIRDDKLGIAKLMKILSKCPDADGCWQCTIVPTFEGIGSTWWIHPDDATTSEDDHGNTY